MRPAQLCRAEQMSCEEREVASTVQSLESNLGEGRVVVCVPGASLVPRAPLFILSLDPDPPP